MIHSFKCWFIDSNGNPSEACEVLDRSALRAADTYARGEEARAAYGDLEVGGRESFPVIVCVIDLDDANATARKFEVRARLAINVDVVEQVTAGPGPRSAEP